VTDPALSMTEADRLFVSALERRLADSDESRSERLSRLIEPYSVGPDYLGQLGRPCPGCAERCGQCSSSQHADGRLCRRCYPGGCYALEAARDGVDDDEALD
jgi:hypothetical protein